MPNSGVYFDTVREIGLALPGVEASTAYGSPALKVRGKLLACVPANRSAEPGSLMVRVGFDDRTELLAAAADVYYVTDHYLDYKDVPTLPNLSYRIVRGDSLLERLFGHVVQLDVLSRNAKTQKLIRAIQADKEAYFGEARTDAKRKLELTILSKHAELAEHLVEAKEQSLLQTNLTLFGESTKDRKLREQREEEEKTLAKLRARIHSAKVELEKLANRQLQANPASSLDQVRRRFFQAGDCPTFLWQVDFAEVFADKGGFDIIIGNPPYLFGGNIGISQEDKLAFRKLYRSGSGKVNLFTLFIEKGLCLLAQNRPLVYIVPNTLLRVTSYDSIRELVVTSHTISMIVDLGAGMFDDVTMSTIVISIQSGTAAPSHQIEVRTSLTETGRRGNREALRTHRPRSTSHNLPCTASRDVGTLQRCI
jgi:hypothetical protein